jgi:hypothetical protein
LNTQVISTDGNPNAPGLNGFLMDHVTYAARGDIAANATMIQSGFATLFTPGAIIVGNRVSVNVTSQLDASWAAAHPQFQIRIYPGGTNSNQIPDVVYLRRGAAENTGIVAPGLLEPDPDNRMRLVIEYFD